MNKLSSFKKKLENLRQMMQFFLFALLLYELFPAGSIQLSAFVRLCLIGILHVINTFYALMGCVVSNGFLCRKDIKERAICKKILSVWQEIELKWRIYIVLKGGFRMDLIIRGENITVTPSLQDYAEKRISKLEKYFNEPIDTSARVNLRVHNTDQVVEVTIPLQGLLLRAEVGEEDLYTAIDGAVTKLERQIKKHKTKINRKSRQGLRQAVQNASSDITATKPTEEDTLDVVRRKHFVFKPMTVEEAILQMDMLGHSFYVFNNAEDNSAAVVYRRKDGRYGLIDQV